MEIQKLIFNNFWLKLLSLVLAIATWFYVFDLVTSDSHLQKDETAEDVFMRYKFAVKEVPVKPVFVGKTPEGYRTIFEKMVVKPDTIHIFGPEEVIENVQELKTGRIDLGEYTRSTRITSGINSDVKFLEFEEDAVDIYLPVEPVAKDTAEKKP